MKQYPLKFPVGTPVPIQIVDWQFSFAATFGNRPTILIEEETTDELGASCKRQIPDATVFMYPQTGDLERVKIIYGSSTLENPLIVTIKA